MAGPGLGRARLGSQSSADRVGHDPRRCAPRRWRFVGIASSRAPTSNLRLGGDCQSSRDGARLMKDTRIADLRKLLNSLMESLAATARISRWEGPDTVPTPLRESASKVLYHLDSAK